MRVASNWKAFFISGTSRRTMRARHWPFSSSSSIRQSERRLWLSSWTATVLPSTSRMKPETVPPSRS